MSAYEVMMATMKVTLDHLVKDMAIMRARVINLEQKMREMEGDGK